MEADNLQCPSAQPHDWPGGVTVFGATGGGTLEAPQIDYFSKPLPVSEETVTAWRKAGIQPGEVFRFTGTCKTAGCRQWDQQSARCSLIDRWVTALTPPSGAALPSCAIRASCRGWHQRGRAACRVCPQVVSQWITGAVAGDQPLPQKVYL